MDILKRVFPVTDSLGLPSPQELARWANWIQHGVSVGVREREEAAAALRSLPVLVQRAEQAERIAERLRDAAVNGEYPRGVFVGDSPNSSILPWEVVR